MSSRIFTRLFVIFYMLTMGQALAEPVKPVAVITFNDGSDMAREQAAAISARIARLRADHRLFIDGHVLSSEDQLKERIEAIAEEEVGLIVIINPRDMDALAKLPGLYPDLRFSIIGASGPLYMNNVSSLVFAEEQGAYLMGLLAALASKSGTVGFTAGEDRPEVRRLAFAFLQGAKAGRGNIRIIQQLGVRNRSRTIPQDNADISFILDPNVLETAIRKAKMHKRLLITFDQDLTKKHPGMVLTSLIKHYDFALETAFKQYRQGPWKSGTRILGVGDGFIDYVLNSSNKPLFSTEMIDRIETAKDLLAQGVIHIRPLEGN